MPSGLSRRWRSSRSHSTCSSFRCSEYPSAGPVMPACPVRSDCSSRCCSRPNYTFFVYAGAPWTFAFSSGVLFQTFPRAALLGLYCIAILCVLPSRYRDGTANPFGAAGLVAFALGLLIAVNATLTLAIAFAGMQPGVLQLASMLRGIGWLHPLCDGRVCRRSRLDRLAASGTAGLRCGIGGPRACGYLLSAGTGRLAVALRSGAHAFRLRGHHRQGCSDERAAGPGRQFQLDGVSDAGDLFLRDPGRVARRHATDTGFVRGGRVGAAALPAMGLCALDRKAGPSARSCGDRGYSTRAAPRVPATIVFESRHTERNCVVSGRYLPSNARSRRVPMAASWFRSSAILVPTPRDRAQVSAPPDEYLLLKVGQSSGFAKKGQVYSAGGGPFELRFVDSSRDDLIAMWYQAVQSGSGGAAGADGIRLVSRAEQRELGRNRRKGQ